MDDVPRKTTRSASPAFFAYKVVHRYFLSPYPKVDDNLRTQWHLLYGTISETLRGSQAVTLESGLQHVGIYSLAHGDAYSVRSTF